MLRAMGGMLALTATCAALASPQRIADREGPGVHNLVEWTPGVLSGAVPEGEPAFAHLQSLGVRTILSVDGARPDIELAARYGIRYAHVPIRYNGVDAEPRDAIAAALRDLPRPIYIHCLHGMHRAPAATALALVLLGELANDEAIGGMKTAGTAPSYAGLYQCVADAAPAGDAIEIRGEDLPPVAQVAGYVQGMVALEHAQDHLARLQQAGWIAPADHPDLVPVAEAGALHDAARACDADERTARQPEDFRRWMAELLADSLALEATLAAPEIDRAEADRLLSRINANCKACHVIYRNE